MESSAAAVISPTTATATVGSPAIAAAHPADWLRVCTSSSSIHLSSRLIVCFPQVKQPVRIVHLRAIAAFPNPLSNLFFSAFQLQFAIHIRELARAFLSDSRYVPLLTRAVFLPAAAVDETGYHTHQDRRSTLASCKSLGEQRRWYRYVRKLRKPSVRSRCLYSRSALIQANVDSY